jgi:hypothetical protein
MVGPSEWPGRVLGARLARRRISSCRPKREKQVARFTRFFRRLNRERFVFVGS